MRKLLVLLESGLLFVGLCVGLAAWQQQRALEQPLQLTEERLLDVSSGSTPGGMLARLEAIAHRYPAGIDLPQPCRP
ncbi:hypothetical protein ACLBVT_35930, partial [Pseudomonas aeruginosa]